MNHKLQIKFCFNLKNIWAFEGEHSHILTNTWNLLPSFIENTERTKNIIWNLLSLVNFNRKPDVRRLHSTDISTDV